MNNKSKRSFLKAGLVGSAVMCSAKLTRAGALLKPTPAEIEGPFYPLRPQKDKDFDLTRIEGHSESAKGKVIVIEGTVLETDGTPLEDATVDLWQANAAGRYTHPRDPNRAPLDPNFQGWAIVQSGTQGRFRFKTIFPGAYPASFDWTRPPHIHFKVSKAGYVALTTQMYFPGQVLNAEDRLLLDKPADARELMIATLTSNAPETYHYKLVLKKSGT